MEQSNCSCRIERNYGIDLLRIVSMIMICILHVLSHGGIWEASGILTPHNGAAWFLGIGSYCAVNCYALISGYVGYGKQHNYSHLLYLYLQTVFYTAASVLLFAVIKPEIVSPETIFKAAVPFAYNTYWYFSAYFCLFFFMSFFDLAVDTFGRNVMKKLLVTMFVIFSFLPVVFQSDFAFTNNGFSYLWLAVMYLTGAYIKKYGISVSYRNRINLLAYFFCVIFTWLTKFVTELLNLKITGTLKESTNLISYVSPAVVLCSVFLLLFFSRLTCKKGLVKFIRFFAPASFGVYLLHDEPLVREHLISGSFRCNVTFNPFFMVLMVLVTALDIWLAGSIADKIRLRIFELLRVKKFCISVERRVGSFLIKKR